MNLWRCCFQNRDRNITNRRDFPPQTGNPKNEILAINHPSVTTLIISIKVPSLESGALHAQMLPNTQIYIICDQTGTIGLPRKLWESATVRVPSCLLKWRRCWAALFRRPPRTRSVRWPLPPLPPQRRLRAPCARPRSSSDACRRIWETVWKEKPNSWVLFSFFFLIKPSSQHTVTKTERWHVPTFWSAIFLDIDESAPHLQMRIRTAAQSR